MVVVRADLAAERPGLMDDLYDLFARAKKNAPQPAGIDMTPIGLPANQRALELVTRYAYDQGLIPRRLEVSELFG
jgi:4,5-dihydroxyphthalate decarboxylase